MGTLQAWYSSCWSHSTKAAFQSALQAVLSSCAEQGDSQSSSAQQRYSESVLQLLLHWQQHPDVTLSEARSSWLECNNTSSASIGGFCRQRDRLALLWYRYTGTHGSTISAGVWLEMPGSFCLLNSCSFPPELPGATVCGTAVMHASFQAVPPVIIVGCMSRAHGKKRV